MKFIGLLYHMFYLPGMLFSYSPVTLLWTVVIHSFGLSHWILPKLLSRPSLHHALSIATPCSTVWPTDIQFWRLGLQSIQNVAARLVTGTRRRDHITPVLRDLYWLPRRHIDNNFNRFCHKLMHLPTPGGSSSPMIKTWNVAWWT